MRFESESREWGARLRDDDDASRPRGMAEEEWESRREGGRTEDDWEAGSRGSRRRATGQAGRQVGPSSLLYWLGSRVAISASRGRF